METTLHIPPMPNQPNRPTWRQIADELGVDATLDPRSRQREAKARRGESALWSRFEEANAARDAWWATHGQAYRAMAVRLREDRERRELELLRRLPGLRRAACAEARKHGMRRESKSSSGSAYYVGQTRTNRWGELEIPRLRISDHDVPLTEERFQASLNGGFTWANAPSVNLTKCADEADARRRVRIELGVEEEADDE